MGRIEEILQENSIEFEEIETKEDNPTESRENHLIKTEKGNYFLSFMNERRKGPLYIYDELSQKIKAEAYSFNQFKEKIGLKCPKVVDTDFETYIMFTEIEGNRTIWEFDEDKPEKNRQLARKLGRLLGKIHSIEYQERGFFNKSGIEKINWEKRIKSFLPHLEPLVEEKYDQKALELLKKNKELIGKVEGSFHVHGDFHPWNTISTGEEVAVIDAEDSMAAPREWDLGKTLGFWGIKFQVENAFLEGYQEKQDLKGGWRKRVRYYTVLQILVGTLRAKKTGWESLHEEHYPSLKQEVKNFSN